VRAAGCRAVEPLAWRLSIENLSSAVCQRTAADDGACNEKAAWSLVSPGACVRVRNGSSLPAIDSALQGRTWYPRGVKGPYPQNCQNWT